MFFFSYDQPGMMVDLSKYPAETNQMFLQLDCVSKTKKESHKAIDRERAGRQNVQLTHRIVFT